MIIDEVTRALECCKDGRCDICGRQGQFADERMCRFDLLEHAYHVIGCQKKEIDKLTADVDALEKGVKAEKERADALAQRWIPVTERLPGVNEKVLFITKTYTIYCGWYTVSHGLSYNKGFETESGFVWLGMVTHWMPLPDAPGVDGSGVENED